MSAKKTQVLLIIGSLVLFVLLFIAPKLAPKNSDSMGQNQPFEKTSVLTNGNIEVYVNMALKNVVPEQKQLIDKLLVAKKYDSLVVIFGKLKRPDIASHYAEELAKDKGGFENWKQAGNRYYYSVQFIQDKSEIPLLYQSAMRCYNKALSINKSDSDTRIMLASCYVEGTQDPMEGVSRLREIEKTDSNNVKLQLTFAFFSVRSQQMDKAIERFKKVLRIDSSYVEAYLHLADAYEQRGETEKTIEMLEKYSAKTPDVTARLEINKYIQQLKQK